MTASRPRAVISPRHVDPQRHHRLAVDVVEGSVDLRERIGLDDLIRRRRNRPLCIIDSVGLRLGAEQCELAAESAAGP